MILCDIGNTSYHFLDDNQEYKKSVKNFDITTITEKVYFICVNVEVKAKLQKVKNWIDLEEFISRDNYYSTMGIDRVVACESIQNGIIVDAGSAITVDKMKNGSFEGGFIYPGIKAMAQSYKNISTSLDYSFNFECEFDIMPKNSQDALSYGYLKLLYNEVVSFNIDIFLTGGDAEKFAKIFPQAKIEKHLVFNGMKKIIKKACLC